MFVADVLVLLFCQQLFNSKVALFLKLDKLFLMDFFGC
jgi:hypothetical protein